MEFDFNNPEQVLKAFEVDMNGQTAKAPNGGAIDHCVVEQVPAWMMLSVVPCLFSIA